MAIGDSKIKHHQSKHDGNLKYEEEIFKGEQHGDTKVTYGEHIICWISGTDIEKFDNKFIELINCYRI